MCAINDLRRHPIETYPSLSARFFRFLLHPSLSTRLDATRRGRITSSRVFPTRDRADTRTCRVSSRVYSRLVNQFRRLSTIATSIPATLKIPLKIAAATIRMDRSTLEFLQETIIKLKVISQKIKVDLRIPIYAANLFRINLIDHRVHRVSRAN